MDHIFFPSEEGLEGLVEFPAGPVLAGVVVAHPHPLYGGAMTNPVVHNVARACRDAGLAALRFNFRGTGRSAGRHNGREEWQDVRAAADYLRKVLPAGTPLALAGYSFGAWMVALAVANGEKPAAVSLVALPTTLYGLDPGDSAALSEYGGPLQAIMGEWDDIAPPAGVLDLLGRLGLRPEAAVVKGADHLFARATHEVGDLVARFLVRCAEGERE